MVGMLLSMLCAACQSEPLTAPAGLVDTAETFTFDPIAFPPPIGRPDPYSSAMLKQTAERYIGRPVASIVGYHVTSSVFGGWLETEFLPAAEPSEFAGLCQVRPFAVFEEPRKPTKKHWKAVRYGVAGGLAPLSKPWAANYRRKFAAACAARRDMGYWFQAKPLEAYIAARLADTVTAAARLPDKLPFVANCLPFPPDAPIRPACQNKARAVLAKINPRAIMRIEPCEDRSRADCLSISIAKDPSTSDVYSNQWDLRIDYRERDGVLNVQSVDIGDSQFIIE